MTNHWNDLQYANVLLVIGSNPAENHPISFRWISKAQENGATLITIDPRFTRTLKCQIITDNFDLELIFRSLAV